MRRALFGVWIVVTVVAVLQIARYPADSQSWIFLAFCIVGLGLNAPIQIPARVRKTIIIRRALAVVYDFLSRPGNLHLWNRRVGPSQPAEIPVAVGQHWTYLPPRSWIRIPSLRHAFSKVEPPHMLEITAERFGIRTVYSYTLRESQRDTVLTYDATVYGMPFLAAWLISAYGRLVPSRDLARLKRALELRAEAR